MFALYPCCNKNSWLLKITFHCFDVNWTGQRVSLMIGCISVSPFAPLSTTMPVTEAHSHACTRCTRLVLTWVDTGSVFPEWQKSVKSQTMPLGFPIYIIYWSLTFLNFLGHRTSSFRGFKEMPYESYEYHMSHNLLHLVAFGRNLTKMCVHAAFWSAKHHAHVVRTSVLPRCWDCSQATLGYFGNMIWFGRLRRPQLWSITSTHIFNHFHSFSRTAFRNHKQKMVCDMRFEPMTWFTLQK